MRKLIFLLIALPFFACQNEENTINQNNDGALTKTSPLTSLVLRVVQNPTHWDNLLDGSDCHCVKLPVGITLNGDYLWIDGEDDYYAVWENMDESWTDDDIVHFDFPITISFEDFGEQVITSQAQLDAITCESDGFNEIRCMDFVFPISINTYDTNNQVANTITINTNLELYNFVQNLGSAEIFTIVYPVAVTFGTGPGTTANSNTELENIIEDVITDCDSGGGWGPTPDTLDEIMASGSWHISYCENDDSEPVHYYDGYSFTFNANGTVTATKNNTTNNGTWGVYQDGSHKMIEFFFPNMGGLTNDEWRVTEYNGNNFRLKNDQSSWDGYEYVYFTKN
jgi:hypothetical protein